VLALFYFVGTAAMFLAIDSKRQPLTTNAVLVVGLGVFAYQGIRALSPDQLSGGRADKRLPGDFDPLELAKGIEVAGGADTIIVVGGGTHNPVILRMLTEAAGIALLDAAKLGWQADFIEAQAFAYLAARSLIGLPLSFPETTGVPRPMPGGVVARP